MKNIALGLLVVFFSSVAIAQAGNDALTALENAAAGVSSMDGAKTSAAAAALRPDGGASARRTAPTALAADMTMDPAAAPAPVNHEYESRRIRTDAITNMMRSKDDLFDSWGTAVSSLVVLPYAMMRSGIEKGFAVGGEGPLGYVAAAGLGVVGAVAGIPMGVFGCVGQFIAGFVV